MRKPNRPDQGLHGLPGRKIFLIPSSIKKGAGYEKGRTKDFEKKFRQGFGGDRAGRFDSRKYPGPGQGGVRAGPENRDPFDPPGKRRGPAAQQGASPVLLGGAGQRNSLCGGLRQWDQPPDGLCRYSAQILERHFYYPPSFGPQSGIRQRHVQCLGDRIQRADRHLWPSRDEQNDRSLPGTERLRYQYSDPR